jgi:hypothetical protein
MTDRAGRYRNVALAMCEGRILCHYAKRINGGDRAVADRHGAAWEPGVTEGTFIWRGLRVGLEVCADHSVAQLRWTQARGREPLHLQLITSCGMDVHDYAVAVGNGGAVICVDGAARNRTSAGRVRDGQFETSYCAETDPAARGFYRFEPAVTTLVV